MEAQAENQLKCNFLGFRWRYNSCSFKMLTKLPATSSFLISLPQTLIKNSLSSCFSVISLVVAPNKAKEQSQRSIAEVVSFSVEQKTRALKIDSQSLTSDLSFCNGCT